MAIHKLPQEVALKIAAGEVVERPVSVVKEALENSLDANSKRVQVTLKDGGKTSIVIEDNGSGIVWDEMPLVVTRYATSKISTIEDLNKIKTLGYRGEAIASIAAVSRVDLRSKISGATEGGLLKAEAGEITCHEKIPWKEGTRLQVDDLFFNFPARKKFLRSNLSELRKISSVVRDYAVAYPEVAFSLYHNGNKNFETDGRGERHYILSLLWGVSPEIRSTVVSCGSIELECWWQPTPGRQKNSITSFVNGRNVSDPLIRGAASAACKDLSGNWMFFFSLSPELVDVNIHPAKAEIRFRYPSEVFEVVKVASLDLQNRPTKLTLPSFPVSSHLQQQYETIKEREAENLFSRVSSPLIQEETSLHDDVEEMKNILEEKSNFIQNEDSNENETSYFFIAQMRSGYLLFEKEGNLILVDPHAAHERINYEKILSRIKVGDVASQKMTTPLAIPPTLATEVEEYKDALISAGFIFEEEEGQLYLSAFPALPIQEREGPLFLVRTTILTWKSTGSRDIDDVLWRKWATIACKQSVKLTTHCDASEALHLLSALHYCENPSVCPHGRPTTLILDNHQIEQYFGREK